MKAVPLFALLLFLAGCGGRAQTTVDATSDTTLKASVNAMTAAMSSAEREQFESKTKLVLFLDALSSSDQEKMQKIMHGLPPDQPGASAYYKPIHGMTATQIAKKAASIQKTSKEVTETVRSVKTTVDQANEAARRIQGK